MAILAWIVYTIGKLDDIFAYNAKVSKEYIRGTFEVMENWTYDDVKFTDSCSAAAQCMSCNGIGNRSIAVDERIIMQQQYCGDVICCDSDKCCGRRRDGTCIKACCNIKTQRLCTAIPTVVTMFVAIIDAIEPQSLQKYKSIVVNIPLSHPTSALYKGKFDGYFEMSPLKIRFELPHRVESPGANKAWWCAMPLSIISLIISCIIYCTDSE